jgi:hypothetical protein
MKENNINRLAAFIIFLIINMGLRPASRQYLSEHQLRTAGQDTDYLVIIGSKRWRLA